MIVSSVPTGAATAALGNSQGGSRGGKAGRERERDESGIKINGQKPFLCSSALSPLPRKARVDGSPLPPSPLCLLTLAPPGFSTFSAATGTEDGVRLVGDSGRFLCFCLGLSLSFRLCKTNQGGLEGQLSLCGEQQWYGKRKQGV